LKKEKSGKKANKKPQGPKEIHSMRGRVAETERFRSRKEKCYRAKSTVKESRKTVWGHPLPSFREKYLQNHNVWKKEKKVMKIKKRLQGLGSEP